MAYPGHITASLGAHYGLDMRGDYWINTTLNATDASYAYFSKYGVQISNATQKYGFSVRIELESQLFYPHSFLA